MLISDVIFQTRNSLRTALQWRYFFFFWWH